MVTGAQTKKVLTEMMSVSQAKSTSLLQACGYSRAFAESVAACAEWSTSYPLERVKKARRFEAICPMVAPSLAADGMRFVAASVAARDPELTSLDEILRSAADRFETIDCGDLRLRCLVLVLPEVRGGRLLEATDPSREIKDELLARGILAGEFFPSCPFATTFNPRLFALRSPAPMYVLRTFLESDWRFICQQPKWQATYRARFGDPPAKMKHLGGFAWRTMQKLAWRWEAIKEKILPDAEKLSQREL